MVSNGRTIDSLNIIDRLCYIGTRGMGTFEFYPDKNREFNESEEIEHDQLVDLSNQILNQKEKILKKDKDDFKEIIKEGTSF